MTRAARAIRAAAALAVMLPGAATAGDAPAAPAIPAAAYLQAFNDTCRRGFPDLDAIARNAAAQGWIERTLKLAGGGVDPLAGRLPRAFAKSRLMLFLTKVPDGPVAASCQVTSPDETKLTGAEVIAVVTPSLNAGPPAPLVDKTRDAGRWAVAPGLTVTAGIVINGRLRTASISVEKAR